MKNRCDNLLRCIISTIAVFTLLMSVPGNFPSAHAQSSPLADLSSDEEIRISSDNLTVDDEAKYAEFYGNVKASQGKNEIRSDKLMIYYKASLGKNKEQKSGEDAIDRVVAYGNVKIRLEDIIAVTDEATYKVTEQVLILNGKNSKVTRGNDSISGAKITLSRVDGKVNIQGAKKSRVEAVFYPGKKQ